MPQFSKSEQEIANKLFVGNDFFLIVTLERFGSLFKTKTGVTLARFPSTVKIKILIPPLAK
jgi:hypothetical protein